MSNNINNPDVHRIAELRRAAVDTVKRLAEENPVLYDAGKVQDAIEAIKSTPDSEIDKFLVNREHIIVIERAFTFCEDDIARVKAVFKGAGAYASAEWHDGPSRKKGVDEYRWSLDINGKQHTLWIMRRPPKYSADGTYILAGFDTKQPNADFSTMDELLESIEKHFKEGV